VNERTGELKMAKSLYSLLKACGNVLNMDVYLKKVKDK